LRRYRKRTVPRLAEAGILTDRTLAIHCVHVNDYAIRQLQKSRANVVHCPRSNLSNAVGVAPVVKIFRQGIRVGLGSDGFGANIIDDAYAAIFTWRLNERTPVAGSSEIEVMLGVNNPLIAGSLLGQKLGVIEPGYSADIAIFRYDSPTPLGKENLFWHLLSKEARAETVIVAGRVVLENFKSTLVDEAKIFEKSKSIALSLWERM
jgi:cytosine/adenosine deaminase-related metal-dependent hydrolase